MREERPDLELELGLGPIDLSFLDASPFDLSFLDLKLDELPDFKVRAASAKAAT